MSLGVKVMHDTCCCTIWYWGHEAPLYFVGIGTYVRNDFKSASTSLSASLFSSRGGVARVGLYELEYWPIVPICQSGKDYWVLEKDSSSRIHQSESPSAFFVLRHWGLNMCSRFRCCWWFASLGIWLYCHKYCLSERVPIGCEVVSCVAKASFSPCELLREATS